MMTKLDKVKAKKIMEETATRTVKVTMTIVKIIFVLIIFYTVAVSIWIFLTTDAKSFLTNIATISVGGFWAFFLGYFGWRMGQTLELYFISMKKRK
jgi:membrane protein YdbS with pleckstrin-like domain